MGSPLGPVIANIFMVQLERETIPKLADTLTGWKRYVDDTIAFVKKGQAEQTLNQLNKFETKIKFTYERAVNNSIPFLDTRVTWKPEMGHFENNRLQESDKYRPIHPLGLTSPQHLEESHAKRTNQ